MPASTDQSHLSHYTLQVEKSSWLFANFPCRLRPASGLKLWPRMSYSVKPDLAAVTQRPATKYLITPPPSRPKPPPRVWSPIINSAV